MDRYDLYELCVQSPRHAVQLLDAIHGGAARVLAEDFCGTASVSREWVKKDGRSAIGADIDPVVLVQARRRCEGAAASRVVLCERDVIGSAHNADEQRADVVFVGNFSIGEVHDRGALVQYLSRSRARLAPGGVFVCDTYGGESAFRAGAVTRRHAAADGSIIDYTWEQRRADASTAMVENVLHFRVQRGGDVIQDLPEAFTYRWRLWSIPELRDAMADAGFGSVSVHQSLAGGGGDEALPPSYIVCVAARNV